MCFIIQAKPHITHYALLTVVSFSLVLWFVGSLALFFFLLGGRIEGLKAVVITDAEGVSLIKVTAGDEEEDAAVESVITPSFLVTATAAAEQSCKLGTGANTAAIIAFEKFQVVHTVASPLMIHLVSAASSNTGLLLDMARDLKTTIAPLQAKMAAESQ